MTYNTYAVDDIAHYILSLVDPEDNDVSNLKLQKLCYYAQGILTAARRGVPLFESKLCAWDHGPVVPDLYHKYKQYGREAIPSVENFDAEFLINADRQAINDVYNHYGQFSAWRLRNMSHADKPWIDAYNRSDLEITVDELVDYFAPQLNDEYVKRVYGKKVT